MLYVITGYKHVKNINAALSEKHVCKLYDMLKRAEATILA